MYEYEVDILPDEFILREIKPGTINQGGDQELQACFMKRGEIVRSTSSINCVVCGRITLWYGFWNASDGSIILEVYCPNCRLNDWIESNYGFTTGHNFDEFWEEYGEEDLGEEITQSE